MPRKGKKHGKGKSVPLGVFLNDDSNRRPENEECDGTNGSQLDDKPVALQCPENASAKHSFPPNNNGEERNRTSVSHNGREADPLEQGCSKSDNSVESDYEPLTGKGFEDGPLKQSFPKNGDTLKPSIQCEKQIHSSRNGSIEESGPSMALERNQNLNPERGRKQVPTQQQETVGVKLCKLEQIEKVNFEFKQKFNLNSEMALRPGFGRNGRYINLVSNFFALKCNIAYIYQYDIEITSLDMIKKYGKQFKRPTAAENTSDGKSRIEQQQVKNTGKERSRRIFTKLVDILGLKSFNPVYDAVNTVYTSKPLPFTKKEIATVEIEIEGKLRAYEISIQPTKRSNGSNCIDLNDVKKMYAGGKEVPHDVVTALNTVLNHREPHSKQIQLGRSFFFLDQTRKVSIGEGLEIWFGYNQNVHFTQKGTSIVINVAAKAMHKAGPLIDYVNEILRRDICRGFMKPHEIERIEEALKDVQINVTHLPYRRKYCIQGLSKSSAKDLILPFDKTNDKYISVAQYFKSRYGDLLYPYLPCVHVRSNNNGTYIPLEKCVIVEGQPKKGLLKPSLNSKMIQETTVDPAIKFNQIVNEAQTVKKQSGKQMQNFGLFMELTPTNVQGRVISPPALEYYSHNVCQPDNRGVWRLDGKQFYRTSNTVKSWILISFVDNFQHDLKEFAFNLSKFSEKVGLKLGTFFGIRVYGPHHTTEKALKEAQGTGASFAMVVLEKNDTDHTYEELKFIADYKLGFVTQCITSNVVYRTNQPRGEQIASNICLKINMKLGGVNHILKDRPLVFRKPVIVFGADAVHSARGSGCPSIASVVGSLDAYPSRYKLACRVQENPDVRKQSQELILEIKDMVLSILHAFREHTRGKHPEKIIFFRDGVSEGQFEKVRDFEVSEVQRASYEFIGSIIPITFIIVQKRHQYRFRPHNPKDGIPKTGNVPPGTTVDTDVTHPVYFDYFLSSHEGLRGTSKPAHYTVLHDDNKFSADEIQELSYHLCHMYGKCNRSISIPAPVMYADLAAYRAKKFADLHIRNAQKGSPYKDNKNCKLPDHARDAINNMGNVNINMFYL